MLRITFSINSNNELCIIYYLMAIGILVMMQLKSISLIDKSQKSVYLLGMSNVSDVESNVYCGILYDDCRCFSVLTENCLSNARLRIARISPLACFVLYIFFIRELFSLHGAYKCLFVCLLWIISMFIFIGILLIVYWHPCYYGVIALFLCCTGFQIFFGLWFIVSLHCGPLIPY